MKCPHCQRDIRYRERSGRQCPQCRKRFAFEPREGDLLSDLAFKSLLDRLSDQGTLAWNTRQLQHALRRPFQRQQFKQRQGLIIGSLFGGLVLGVIGFNLLPSVLWLLLMLGGGSVTARLIYRQFKASPFLPLSRTEAETLLQRWEAVHGPATGKLSPPQLKPATGDKNPLSESYNVGQALICDRPETVAFLLANDFHIEQRCAILSVGGYPPDDFEGLRQMLKRNPQLNVFVLHDASYNGCQLYHTLITEPDWFKGSKRVFDLGLFPRHAQRLRGHWTAAGASYQRTPLPGYSEADNIWLQHHELSLMALPPKTLLKQIQRLLSRHAQQASEAYARDDESGWEFESEDLLRIGEIGDSDSDFG
ncbi:MAG: hypothetical protein IGS03_04425 [Candidatus Sericytochromatia bacterium]|nr:hypothetical protein [Candidatus Sericytochromatia bacterium]